MSESDTGTAEPELSGVLDEAEATLGWVESRRGPAVVRMARLRLVLAAAGYGALAVEAAGLFSRGGPVVPEDLNDTCRDAADVIEAAIGPELAGRWAIDGVFGRLSPEKVAAEAGAGLLPVAVTEQAMARVGSLVGRTVEVLSVIADDESVLPDLREAAGEVMDLMALARYGLEKAAGNLRTVPHPEARERLGLM